MGVTLTKELRAWGGVYTVEGIGSLGVVIEEPWS
jgi:hypothetical protein